MIIAFAFLGCISAQAQKHITFSEDHTSAPYVLRGKIVASSTGEPLVGVNIVVEKSQIGASTDTRGNYMIKLPDGPHQITASHVGYKTATIIADVHGSGMLNFLLDEEVSQLGEVVIAAQGEDENIKSTEVGRIVLSSAQIKTLPSLVGEPDVLKSLTLLPGVSSKGEVSGGINVRGGGSDQNLILIDGAPIYNPSHLFGFFSSINSSLVRDVRIYKGFVPARYGGRASSVVDISLKTGSLSKWGGDLNVGIASSAFSAGGPLVPGKASVLLGGRVSYSDWLLRTTRKPEIRNSSANFYDGNIILSIPLSQSSEVRYSYHGSYDNFSFARDTAVNWQNHGHVVQLSHNFRDRLDIKFSASRNSYYSSILGTSEFDPFDLKNAIDHDEIKLSFKLEINQRQSIETGGEIKFIGIDPGTLVPGVSSSLEPVDVRQERATESGIYLQHDIDLTRKLAFSFGLRYSRFRLLGEGSINQYRPLNPRRPENVIGTIRYENRQLIKEYHGFEPRGSVRFQFDENTSIKVGINRMFQYMHLVSNTSSVFPTDVWKLSDPFLEPQIITQYSIGLFRNFDNNLIEASIEAFYKDWDNIVEYIDGADLFLNDHLETELVNGIGQSYGVELYVRKSQGKLTGWMGYTFSRSLRLVQGPFFEKTINGGQWFPSNFDRPHDLAIVSKYRLGALSSLNAVFSYGSGIPVTYPEAKLDYTGRIIGYFIERNSRRASDYHRLDLSFQFELLTSIKALSGVWGLSIYNVYGRRNPYSVFFADTEGAPPQPFKLSIVGAPIPSIAYRLEF